MASYHFEAKMIGRKQGRSAVAAAAYRAGERLVRDELGDAPDYRRKRGVVSADILVPEGAPEWARDRARLWNAVEAKEKRSNSQLARHFDLALPNEMTSEEARALVLGWAQRELVSRGMAVDVCIHNPPPRPGKQPNQHVHVMMPTRGFDAGTVDGWARNKNREWNEQELLLHWRESWAEAQNAALAAIGAPGRVDHRSLEAQRDAALAAGDNDLAMVLDRPPEPRMGLAATAIEDKAKEDAARRGVEYRPVTERGRALAQSRGLRAEMMAAYSRLKRAALDLAGAAREFVRRQPFGLPKLPEPDDGTALDY